MVWAVLVFMGVLGWFNGPRKDKLYAYMREPSGKSNGTKLVQSTPVISKSKGLSEILRDIRTSTHQICRIEEKKLIRLTTSIKCMFNWTPEVRDILKILWKRGEIAP